jgi:hypothetical protein
MSSNLNTTSLNNLARQFSTDGWNDAATEPDNRVIKGDLLKFRDGRWYVGSVQIADRTSLVALATAAYWQLWIAAKSTQIIMREPGGVLPDRRELSYLDPQEWPIGLSGDRQDPWQDTRAVFLADPKTARAFTFCTSSMGGHEAVRTLSGQIARMRVAKPGVLAVVALSAAEMKTRYGLKSKPLFEVTGWVGGETLPPEIELPQEAPRVVNEEAAARAARIHIESGLNKAKIETEPQAQVPIDEVPW